MSTLKKKYSKMVTLYIILNEAHATLFTEDSIIIVASKNPRSKKFYEEDTKKYILI